MALVAHGWIPRETPRPPIARQFELAYAEAHAIAEGWAMAHFHVVTNTSCWHNINLPPVVPYEQIRDALAFDGMEAQYMVACIVAMTVEEHYLKLHTMNMEIKDMMSRLNGE